MKQTVVVLLDIDLAEGEELDAAELATWLALKLQTGPRPEGDPWHPSNVAVYASAQDLTADLREGLAAEHPAKLRQE